MKGSKSNKHNIIGVCLSGLQSVVKQVQRLAPPSHFTKTINISEYPEYSGEMIFFADTDGIAQINSKELEVVDPKMPEDKIASDFEMSAKKKYLLGVLYEWVYVEGRKVIVFTMWP
ncbi:hypothetical protein D6D28_09973 [Aureobasidium pullulans]|uniref:Uncharacterized protein n=1 Tax=Aureobasidium pullulans TaxID=5580 RepID=A0A4S8RZI7_AURPU|nr:hypothetical protein D6D28_09973 [Aureobasidium pullulans]